MRLSSRTGTRLALEQTRAASLDGLRSAQGYLQRLLARELTLKHTPTLTFAYDSSIDTGMRITELLSDERPDD